MAPGGDWQAHHIIARASKIMEHKVVQNAAKSKHAFHIDEALNGIPLETTVHYGSHVNYDNFVGQYLDAIPENATPDEAYSAVISLISASKKRFMYLIIINLLIKTFLNLLCFHMII